jgi:hypothetical protein
VGVGCAHSLVVVAVSCAAICASAQLISAGHVGLLRVRVWSARLRLVCASASGLRVCVWSYC